MPPIGFLPLVLMYLNGDLVNAKVIDAPQATMKECLEDGQKFLLSQMEAGGPEGGFLNVSCVPVPPVPKVEKVEHKGPKTTV